MKPVRKYVSIDEIQKEYLPISKKKIRAVVKDRLLYTVIGKRMYVDRQALETMLAEMAGTK